MADAAKSGQSRWRRGHLCSNRFWSRAAWSHALAAALLVFCAGASAAANGVIKTPVPNLQIRSGTTTSAGGGALTVQIAPLLYRQLASGGRRDFSIEFRERADLSAARSLGWNARGRFVYDRLRETAGRSQSSVQRMLSRRGITFHSYWIKNAILVEQGDIAALQAAAGFAEVARIRELPKAALIKPEHPAVAARAASSGGVTPNIAWVGANQVWNDGTTGDGVTVGIIDDGVFYRHEAVVSQYRGNLGSAGFNHDYNWYAPTDLNSEPNGSQGEGHGTHVTGAIVGDNRASDPSQRQRVGMAPGAKWIACLGLPIKGSEFALPACGEFMLAPTKTDGSAPDPDRRPQIVNNSWGSTLCNGSADDFYRDIVEAWVAAGIFPVFAAGNASNCGLPEPPGLSTVTSPASLGSAFAVGSSGNHDGHYATHSLWGPSLDASAGLPNYPDPRGYPTLKPQVVAPGVDILSAIDGGNGYATMTGTSMSAPHISGLVALMLEAGECLRGDYATLGGLIMQSARPIDYASGGEPPPGLGNLPNYATGWGEIDAPHAVDAAAHACGPQGFIRGVVKSSSGTPIAGATVEIFVDEAVRVYQATSDSDGSYVRRVPVNTGSGYSVRVSAYGYLPANEAGVLVTADETTRHDVELATAATYKINGRVTDAATGWALHAKVEISGYPNGPIWTDPTTGSYSVRLPEGRAYRLSVVSDVGGYQSASRELASISAGGAQDFALAADPVACMAPGYAYASTLLNEGFENNGANLPGGWSRSSSGLGWLFGDSAALSGSILVIPAHGHFAATNDELGAGGGWDNDGSVDYLQLPTLNLSTLANPVLRYRSYFIDAGGRAHVEASTDGGATWSALGTPKLTNGVEGWTDETVSLASIAASAARVRFHSDDGTANGSGALAGGWAVDDVAIQGACAAPAHGGLVIGHVRDANTGAGLNGAVVSANGGAAITTATSADPGVGDGFFALYAPNGTPTLTAERGSQPAGYGNASLTPSVSTGATVLGELALPAGRLRLYPAGPTASVELGTTATVPFTVSNSGTLPLNFGFEGVAIEEHFDSPLFPPNGWTIQNVGAGCGWIALDPSHFANTAGGDGGAAMVDPYPCWGGANSDTALISPPLDLSTSHTASMGFFLSLLEGADSFPRLDVDVSTDGGTSWTTVHSETHDNNGSGPGALIELDLSAFVGASNARVRFHYTATPPWGWVIVDQIHLFNTISASAMLDLTPDSGALAIGASRTLDATFDARTVTQPGVYTLPIRVAENTPYAWPFGDVAATMTVTAPATYGSLGGIVQDLGYCDANPRALSGATITIHGSNGHSYTTTSAADGSYRYWVEAAQGPFTVIVEAGDHLTATQQFNVDAGVETAASFGMRSLQACLLTDPATPSATVASGQSVQAAFDLLNAGAAAADWTLRSGGDPAVLSRVPLVQTTSPIPVQNVSFGCVNPNTGHSLENRYLRRFDLAQRGVPIQNTTIGGISFAVDSATSSSGSQPITVRIHALNGELTLENLQLLAEKTIDVPDTTLTRVSVVFDQPLQVAGDSVLVAEIYVPSGATGGNAFYPGGNREGETAPAYWAARDCGASEPISFADAGVGWVNMILEIDTLASDPCGTDATPVDWLAVSQPKGHIGADASIPLEATFTAGSRTEGDYHGAMCVAPGRTTTNPVVVPITMHVGTIGDRIFSNGFD
jgi:subtilisin family serine protease